MGDDESTNTQTIIIDEGSYYSTRKETLVLSLYIDWSLPVKVRQSNHLDYRKATPRISARTYPFTYLLL